MIVDEAICNKIFLQTFAKTEETSIANVASGRRVDLSSRSPNYNATSALNKKLIFFFDLLLSLSLGGTPYPTISNHELLGALKSGYRMDKPQMCSDEM